MTQPLAQAMWTHGVGLFLEDNSWTIDRSGFGGMVHPSNTSLGGWVHFVIPTTVIVNDRRLQARQTGIRVATGPKATITSVRVHDGERQLAENDNLKIGGPPNTYYFPIPGTPQILWGVEISVFVSFTDTSSDAWATFLSGGIDFQ
jgi:hypothetical protein